jgi:hypothetical protein
MTKRSTNLNRAHTHRTTANDLAALAEWAGLTEDDVRQAVERAAEYRRMQQRQLEERATWRVSWKKRASDEWTCEYFTSRAEAFDRKHVLRSRLCAVAMHCKHADGTWVGA